MGLEIHYKEPGVYVEPREGIEIARTAVDAGFEGVWTGDHFLPWLDTYDHTQHVLPWFGALMAEIPDVPVGPSVTCPIIRYHPPILAQAIATLDNMYPGRFQFGVGTGEAVNEAFFLDGEWPDWGTRVEMLLEALDLMEDLWYDDAYRSHHGTHYDYEDVTLYTRPKTEVPVHWSGLGPRSCRIAGENGYHLLTLPPADADPLPDHVVENYHAGLREAGVDPADRHLTVQVSVNFGDPDALVSTIRENDWYLPLDTEMDNPDPRSIRSVAADRLAEMSDAELREIYHITEDPGEIVDLFEAYEAAGVTRVIVEPVGADPAETIATFEDAVLPTF